MGPKKKRFDCSKCREKAAHTCKASECPKPYPLYDQQVCDNCLESGHENRDCPTSPPEKSCKSCGHGNGNGCSARRCLQLGGKDISEIGPEVVDRFTPKARSSWLEKYGTNSSVPLSATLQASSSTFGPSESSPPAADFDDVASEERLQGLYDKEAQEMPQAVSSQSWIPHIQINANFYKMNVGDKAQICKYSVCLDTIIPRGKTEAIPPTRPETKRYLITQLLKENQNIFDRISWATDYESFIVTNKPISGHNLTEIGHITDTPHTRSGFNGAIKMSSSLKYLGSVDIPGLKNHFKSAATALDHPEEELKFLNIISWKKINSPEYKGGRVGKKFYPHDFVDIDDQWMSDKRNDVKLGFKDIDVPLYQIRRGFFSSMRPGQGSILLNINVTTSAFFSPINLAQWIRSNLTAGGDFKRVLKGVRVVFDLHHEDRQKVLNIKSIAPLPVSETKFTKDDGEETSVHAYMRATYPKGSFDKRAYCINVGSNKRPTWYPADHLRIVEWQLVKKNLPEPYVAAIIDATKGPQASKTSIKNTALPELDIVGKGSFYEKFGISPTTSLVEIKAGILNAPKLSFKGADSIIPSEGSWNFKNRMCNKIGLPYTSLFVLWLRPVGTKEYERQYMQDSTEQLAISLRGFGLSQIRDRIFCQSHVPVETPNPETYRQRCATAFNTALSSIPKSFKLIPLMMVVLPERSRKLYPEVKRWGDCDVGIPTVCVVEDTLDHQAKCNSISLKFNLKLQGINQRVTEKCGIKKARTMVVGADVTHPGDEEECPSIAAVVATNDEESFQYLGSARLQEGKQEYISDLKGMIKERVLAWAKQVPKGPPGLGGMYPQIVPDQILFYRDGVSESQFGMVRHHEKQQILDGCSDAYSELKRDPENKRSGALPTVAKGNTWKPKLTLIVAIKRHHARFYPQTVVAKDPNLGAGTIVDSVVVTPNHFSFYLQSHSSPLGTARSTQYVVIHDDMKYRENPQNIMNITNQLCYTSARASKALSVCTPARYADLLCDRLRCYLKPVLEGYRDTGIRDDMDAAQRATVYEGNEIVWKPSQVPLPNGWKNPWSPSISDIMFYL